MTEPDGRARRVVLALTSTVSAETAIGLAERLHARGHRVSVVAHGGAVGLSAGDAPTAARVRDLLRAGVHGAGVDWVVDRAGAATFAAPQVAGVVAGDAGDLWELVRTADVVLSPGHGA